MNKDLLKMKILLQFLEQSEEHISVTSLSLMLGQIKTYISKLMHELEDEGMVDMSDNRRPRLTEKGRETAQLYREKVQVNLHHLLYEGVDAESALQDAYLMALYCSEATYRARRITDQIYRAKLALRDRTDFGGKELCAMLADGRYSVPFYIYKTKGRIKGADLLSMANEGFEQPAILQVDNGVGVFRLKGKTMTAKSHLTGLEMAGKVESVRYKRGRNYVSCTRLEDVYSFPAEGVHFRNLMSGNRQVLHGAVRLSMRCDVGIAHMPESAAVVVFTL